MNNPFKEADIIALADSANLREHALARLKDQQCMEGLRLQLGRLHREIDNTHNALKTLYDLYCELHDSEDFIELDKSCQEVRRILGETTRMKIKTASWEDAGPMISYAEGHIDISDFKTAVKADEDVMELVREAIEANHIQDFDDLSISHTYLGPMSPEWDGDDAMHLDDNGHNYIEICGKDSEGARPITAIDWEDFFV